MTPTGGERHLDQHVCLPFGELRTGNGDGHNASIGAYFLAWQHDSGGRDIRARRFYSDGTAAGQVITVSATADDERSPAVACRSAAGQCLVVWQAHDGVSWDLFGQRVGGAGALQGEVITVTADVTATEKVPDVAYRAGEGEYLVVWQDDHSGVDVIYARRVSVGGVLGDVITVTGVTTVIQRNPAVAYNPDDDEYLVVLQAGVSGDWRIYARRVSGTGVPQGDNLVIVSVSGYDNVLPAVAYDSRAGEYLVVWTYIGSGNDTGVYARRIAPDGTARSDSGAISNATGSRQEIPAVAYGGQAHLVAWQDNRTGDWVIYGRQYGALVADFWATPLIGTVPLTVTLTGESTPWGTIDSYEWDYGDGVTSTTSAVTHSHVYTAGGVYTVSLTVSGDGESDTLTRTNYVTVYPVPVTTIITYTYDLLYRLASASYSSGEVYTYTYDAANRLVLSKVEGLTSVGGVAYTWDAANRLTQVEPGFSRQFLHPSSFTGLQVAWR